jgi:hypothetical protein
MRLFSLILLLGLLIIAGCAKDIVVKPPEGLRGAYEGTYTVREKVGSSNPPEPIRQFVQWTFTDQRFFCDIDTLKNLEIKICNHSGNYEMGNRVTFKDTLVEPGTCDHAHIVIDEFDFVAKRFEDAPDTLEFTRAYGPTEDRTEKVLILIPLEE